MFITPPICVHRKASYLAIDTTKIENELVKIRKAILINSDIPNKLDKDSLDYMMIQCYGTDKQRYEQDNWDKLYGDLVKDINIRK